MTIEGVSKELTSALHALGIHDTAQLLTATGLPTARAKLAESLGIDANRMLEIANRADLTRIHGLTTDYVNLLVLAGVDTVMELSRRIPENLYAKLIMNAAQHHVQELPHLDTVRRWVNEAKLLERAVYY